jgi:hypothetical protein
MTYSINIHSSIINPSKPTLEDKTDQIDSITFDIPLLTRILEFAREDIKDDVQLHDLITNVLKLKDQGTLNMDHYDSIVNFKQKDQNDIELESILKLAGM